MYAGQACIRWCCPCSKTQQNRKSCHNIPILPRSLQDELGDQCIRCKPSGWEIWPCWTTWPGQLCLVQPHSKPNQQSLDPKYRYSIWFRKTSIIISIDLAVTTFSLSLEILAYPYKTFPQANSSKTSWDTWMIEAFDWTYFLCMSYSCYQALLTIDRRLLCERFDLILHWTCRPQNSSISNSMTSNWSVMQNHKHPVNTMCRMPWVLCQRSLIVIWMSHNSPNITEPLNSKQCRHCSAEKEPGELAEWIYRIGTCPCIKHFVMHLKHRNDRKMTDLSPPGEVIVARNLPKISPKVE